MTEELKAMDDWCIKRLNHLRAPMEYHVMKGRSVDDPEYRRQLGQGQAYLAMRSFIHGCLSPSLKDQDNG